MEAKREYFNKLDVVNCGIGMSSINIKRDVTKQEVRDLVHDDSGSPYQKFKAYIRMMDNPRVKLHKIRIFLKNIGWDLKGEKVFVARRRKENGQHESIEEERERTLKYFYDQHELPSPMKEKEALVPLTPMGKRDAKLEVISAKYSGKRKYHADATSYPTPSKRKIDFERL